MDTLLADLRYTLRRMVRDLGFSVPTALTLALGIGVTAAVFGLANTVLIRPLPYREADRLVAIHHAASRIELPMSGISPGLADYYRAHNRVFEGIGVYVEHVGTLTDLSEPERVRWAFTTPGFFSVLRPATSVGRLIGPADYEPPAGEVPGVVRGVLISYDLWVRRYGADPAIVGRTIEIDFHRLPVVGVTEPGFGFPHPDTKVWWAWGWPHDIGARASLRALAYGAIARLKPGLSIDAAERDLERLVHALPEAVTDLTRQQLDEMGFHAVPVPLKDEVVGGVREAVLLLLAAAGFLLLITWANATNLTLVRAERMRREVAMARALGASDGRLARRFLSESLSLAGLAGVLGLALAAIAIDLRFGFAADDIPRLREVGVDWPVLALTFGLSTLSAMLLGSVALVSARRADLAGTLSGGLSRMTAGRREQTARRMLVAAQVAFALTLLIGSALMAQSFWRLKQVKLGFEPAGALSFRLPVSPAMPGMSANHYHDIARVHYEVLGRLRALPGVEAVEAASTSGFPLTPVPAFYNVRLAARDASKRAEEWPYAQLSFATPGYFKAMGIPLLRGRTFRAEDTGREGHGVILSASLAKALFADVDPIGRRVRWARKSTDPDYTVVGVAGDVPSERIRDGPTKVFYFPNLYPPTADTITGVVHIYIPDDEFYVVRTRLVPMSLVPVIQRAIHEVDPKLLITQVGTLEELVAGSMAPARLTMLLLLVAAATALSLGVIGIYGVLAYTVSQRTNELGVRIALGASPASVTRMVVRQGAVLALAGVGVGLLAAAALTRYLRSLLYEVSPSDPVAFAVMAVVLFAVALGASYVPARRAAKVDPMTALRSE